MIQGGSSIKMALYKNINYVKQINSMAFDIDHEPGGIPPQSGIYRCGGCGREIVAEKSRPLPPQNHHQHTYQQGAIRWQMIVYADHEPK